PPLHPTSLLSSLLLRPPPPSPPFPYTTLFRSGRRPRARRGAEPPPFRHSGADLPAYLARAPVARELASSGRIAVTLRKPPIQARSEEHTSELQSLTNLVCRLLLEKKKSQHIPL